MKRLCLALLLTCGILSAKDDWGIEVRASFFSPKSRAVCKAFCNGGFDSEIELSKQLSDHWLAWGNVNYFSKNGHSRHSHTKRHVHLMPYSIGVKYLIPCTDIFRPYVGIGPSYTTFRTNNRRHHKSCHHSKSGFGGVAKFGAYIDMPCNLFLDVFVDYYLCRMNFNSKHVAGERHADVGGVHFGLGLGYHF